MVAGQDRATWSGRSLTAVSVCPFPRATHSACPAVSAPCGHDDDSSRALVLTALALAPRPGPSPWPLALLGRQGAGPSPMNPQTPARRRCLLLAVPKESCAQPASRRSAAQRAVCGARPSESARGCCRRAPWLARQPKHGWVAARCVCVGWSLCFFAMGASLSNARRGPGVCQKQQPAPVVVVCV